MMQSLYENTRALLVEEMTKLEVRLKEGKSELVKFKDNNIFVYDHDKLLTLLTTHQDMLTRKITLCNDKLRQLHSTIGQVISDEQN